MTVNPSGKVQVTFSPALPATCAVCNKSANGSTRFIDFQKDLDYYGAVVICEDCMRESLEILDFAPVARVIQSEEEAALANEKALELEENNVRLNATLDNLLFLRPNLRSSSSGATESDDSSSEEVDRGPAGTVQGLFE